MFLGGGVREGSLYGTSGLRWRLAALPGNPGKVPLWRAQDFSPGGPLAALAAVAWQKPLFRVPSLSLCRSFSLPHLSLSLCISLCVSTSLCVFLVEVPGFCRQKREHLERQPASQAVLRAAPLSNSGHRFARKGNFCCHLEAPQEEALQALGRMRVSFLVCPSTPPLLSKPPFKVLNQQP